MNCAGFTAKAGVYNDSRRPTICFAGGPTRFECSDPRAAWLKVAITCPVIRAGSGGRRNTCLEFPRGSLGFQDFSRALVQAQRELVELRLWDRVVGSIRLCKAGGSRCTGNRSTITEELSIAGTTQISNRNKFY